MLENKMVAVVRLNIDCDCAFAEPIEKIISANKKYLICKSTLTVAFIFDKRFCYLFNQEMENLASYIDHTLLKADARKADIIKLCEEAKAHHFFSVCLNSFWVPLSSHLLNGTNVKVCTVVGFPLGANTPHTKAFEADWAITQGAGEIDMVINIGALKDKDYATVENDIKQVLKATQGHTLKVIIETALLNDEEKISACKIIETAGAHFVKTSTGFSTSGAQIADIHLFKKSLSAHMKIKASGGIKNKEQALEFISAGASRLGTSSGVSLVQGLESKTTY